MPGCVTSRKVEPKTRSSERVVQSDGMPYFERVFGSVLAIARF